MKRKCFFLFLLFISFSLSASEGIVLTADAGSLIPMGPDTETGDKIFVLGGGVQLSSRFPFNKSNFYARGALSYQYMGLNTADNSNLSVLGFGGGIGYEIGLGQRFILLPEFTAGVDLGLYTGNVGISPYIGLGTGVTFKISPNFGLNLGIGYRYSFNLYHGITVSLGTSFRMGGAEKDFTIEEIHLEPVFPVLQTYYNSNPLGSIQLVNKGNDISEYSVTFFSPQYMDQEQSRSFIKTWKTGEEREIPVYGLFTDRILEVTEGTETSALIKFSWNELDREFEISRSATLVIRNRNAHVWDNNEKAAAFITPRDPAVLQFAKAGSGIAGSYETKAVNSVFRQALVIFEMMDLYGLNYVIDPDSSYIEKSADSEAVDYLQFPNQTLLYRAGDCDDLTILFNALLESVSIETAFILVPNHIYPAFSLGVDKNTAESIFGNSTDFIIHDGTAWIPVEATMIKDGFIRAWKEGVRQWEKYFPLEKAAMIPVREAWEVFPPNGYKGTSSINLPEKSDVILRSETALERFIHGTIYSREIALKQSIELNGSPADINKLGVLYARFGLYSQAEAQFRLAAEGGDDSARINLGHIYYLKGNTDAALGEYEKAYSLNTENPSLIIGMAKCYYDKGEFSHSSNLYEKAIALRPGLSDRYAYLKGLEASAKAGNQGEREVYLWDEK